MNRLKQGAQGFYVGTGQVANEIADKLGVGDYDIQNMQRITPEDVKARKEKFADADKLLSEKEGDVGMGASIVQGLGNPLTYIGGAALKGPLMFQGAVQGATSGFLNSSPDENTSMTDRAASAAREGIIGGIAAPVMGGITNMALSPGKTLSNVGSAIGKVLRVNPEKVGAFSETGISPTLGDVVDSGVTKRAQNILGDAPLASMIIDNTKRKTTSQINQKLSEVGFDPTFERVIGGDAAKIGIKNYIEKGRELFRKSYDDFDKKNFVPGEKIDAQNTINKISEITARADNPETLDAYLGSQDKSIIEKLRSLTRFSSSGNMGEDAFFSSSPRLTFNDLKLLRTSVGKKLEDYTIGTSDKSVLRELYGAMTADMRLKAQQKGTLALKTFDRLNNGYARFSDKVDNTLSEFLNKGENSEILTAISRGLPLPEKTATIMRSLPNDKRTVLRGSLIREMGVDRTQKGFGEFDPIKFATKFSALDRKAQDALLIGVPNVSKDNFRKVVQAIQYAKDTSLQNNPSGTARNAVLLSFGAASIQQPALVISTIAGAGLSALAMTNPKFISWLANSPKGIASNPGRYIGLLSGIAATNKDISNEMYDLKNRLESENLTPNEERLKSSKME